MILYSDQYSKLYSKNCKNCSKIKIIIKSSYQKRVYLHPFEKISSSQHKQFSVVSPSVILLTVLAKLDIPQKN